MEDTEDPDKGTFGRMVDVKDWAECYKEIVREKELQLERVQRTENHCLSKRVCFVFKEAPHPAWSPKQSFNSRPGDQDLRWDQGHLTLLDT